MSFVRIVRTIARRPLQLILSSGIVIALIAGTATAAGLIDGQKIKSHSIPLGKLTPTAIESLRGSHGSGGGARGPAGAPGSTGPQGPSGPAGPAGAPATRYWALVTSSGAISRQSGGVSVNLNTNGGQTNHYEVTFPGDVSHCAYLATASDPGTINAETDVLPTVATAARSANDSDTIVVELYYPTMTTAAFPYVSRQDDFSLAVFC